MRASKSARRSSWLARRFSISAITSSTGIEAASVSLTSDSSRRWARPHGRPSQSRSAPRPASVIVYTRLLGRPSWTTRSSVT